MAFLLILVTAMIFAFCVTTPAQTKVEVDRDFLDDANQAFRLVVSLREELKAAYIAIGKEQAEKAALASQVEVLRAIKCNETKTTLFFIYKQTKKVCY